MPVADTIPGSQLIPLRGGGEFSVLSRCISQCLLPQLPHPAWPLPSASFAWTERWQRCGKPWTRRPGGQCVGGPRRCRLRGRGVTNCLRSCVLPLALAGGCSAPRLGDYGGGCACRGILSDIDLHRRCGACKLRFCCLLSSILVQNRALGRASPATGTMSFSALRSLRPQAALRVSATCSARVVLSFRSKNLHLLQPKTRSQNERCGPCSLAACLPVGACPVSGSALRASSPPSETQSYAETNRVGALQAVDEFQCNDEWWSIFGGIVSRVSISTTSTFL